MGAMMKHFIGVGVLAVLALGSRFKVSQRFALDICIHDTYRVISIRMTGFWLLIGIAARRYGREVAWLPRGCRTSMYPPCSKILLFRSSRFLLSSFNNARLSWLLNEEVAT
jgi:hypothetical protein